MMRISAKAEYACVAMMELAAHYGEPQPVPIKLIVETQGIPPRFLVQIVLQLKKAGLVDSLRGAAGGYQLARPPDDITLADIVNAIDDRNLMARSALHDANRSPIVEILLGVWDQIKAEEQRTLSRLTLAELRRRTQQNNALSYQI
jgi:Rrf2 family protein